MIKITLWPPSPHDYTQSRTKKKTEYKKKWQVKKNQKDTKENIKI